MHERRQSGVVTPLYMRTDLDGFLTGEISIRFFLSEQKGSGTFGR